MPEDVKIEETETTQETSPEETEQQPETGEVDKTQEETKEETQEETSKVEGEEEESKPIPYKRFKEVNDKFRTVTDELEEMRADFEERDKLLKNPDVYEAVLRSQGITDKNVINQKMQEVGLQPKLETDEGKLFKQFAEGNDLNTQEGWMKTMWRMAQAIVKQEVSPISQSISERDKTEMIVKWESEAKELSTKLGIEYGESGKTESDPNTAIGKIAGYIRLHPEDAKLGHAKILRLAMSEEGHKLGEQRGIKKEKNRNESLRRSQFEDDNKIGKKKEPSADAPVSELMEWAEQNPDKV